MNFYKNLLKYKNKLLKLNEQFGGEIKCELLLFPLQQLVKIDYQMLINSESIHKYNVIISNGNTKECWDKNNAKYNTYIFNGIETSLSELSVYVHPSVIEAYKIKRKQENIERLEILKTKAISKKALTFNEKELLINHKLYNPEQFKSVIRSSDDMYQRYTIEEWFLI
jgi:hypothetical protein